VKIDERGANGRQAKSAAQGVNARELRAAKIFCEW
jgi:hypothetical protein